MAQKWRDMPIYGCAQAIFTPFSRRVWRRVVFAKPRYYDKFAADFEFNIMINSRHLTPNTIPNPNTNP
jgi:hypothetical protein